MGHETKHRIVVVGNGMVGHRFLEELCDRADSSDYQITVFCAEPRLAYDRVHLSSYFSHHTSEELSLVKPGFYERHGIKVLLGEAVKQMPAEFGQEAAQGILALVNVDFADPDFEILSQDNFKRVVESGLAGAIGGAGRVVGGIGGSIGGKGGGKGDDDDKDKNKGGRGGKGDGPTHMAPKGQE